jgi:hypothetical protein
MRPALPRVGRLGKPVAAGNDAGKLLLDRYAAELGELVATDQPA